MTTKLTPAGHFFLPYSEFSNMEKSSLACYYTRVHRKDNPDDYPISVVIDHDAFTIYWHGKQKRDSSGMFQDYSFSKIFSFTFTQSLQESFEQWLNKSALIRPLPACTLEDYNINNSDRLSFSNTYLYPSYSDTSESNLVESKEKEFGISLQEFFLDLLFDLYYSNVFQRHPKYVDLIDFLNSVPFSKAVLHKARYYWAKAECVRIKNKPKLISEKKVEQPLLDVNEQLKYNIERLDSYRSAWLKFIRSSKGEEVIKVSPWFMGIEHEHELSYDKKGVEDSDVKKEAEDSMQWAIKRYNMLGAFSFQFKIYNCISITFLVLFTLLLSWYAGVCVADGSWISFRTKHNVVFSTLTFVSIIFIAFLVAMLLLERIVIYGLGRNFFYNLIFRKNPWDISNDIYNTLASIPKIISLIKPKILLASGVVWTFLFSYDLPALWDISFIIDTEKELIIVIVLFFSSMFVLSRLNIYIAKDKFHISKLPQSENKFSTNQKKRNQFFSLVLICVAFGVIAYYSEVFWTLKAITVSILLLFLLNQLYDFFKFKAINKKLWFNTLTIRAVFVIILATLYSFIIGCIGMSINSEKELTNVKYLKTYKVFYKNNKYNFKYTFDSLCFDTVIFAKNRFADSIRAQLPDSIKSDSFRSIRTLYYSNTQIQENFTKKIWEPLATEENSEILLAAIYDKVLPELYHLKSKEEKSVLICFKMQMPFFKKLGLDPKLFVLIQPLIFFTFISVAIGLLLEMGLKIEETGIDFG